MGAGDDTVYINYTAVSDLGNLGNPATSITKLDGGAGSDTLYTGGASTLTLTSFGATNFENLVGTNSGETIQGDGVSNTLVGEGGVDLIYGNGGDDWIFADNAISKQYYDPNHPAYNANNAESQFAQEVNNAHNLETVANKLYGGAGKDVLVGAKGDDTLDGGTGADKIWTSGGYDTIILRAGDGGASLTDADLIKDFADGLDAFGLADGLAFSDLTIAQGSGSHSSHTIISKTSSSEYLVVVEGINSTILTEADFNVI